MEMAQVKRVRWNKEEAKEEEGEAINQNIVINSRRDVARRPLEI